MEGQWRDRTANGIRVLVNMMEKCVCQVAGECKEEAQIQVPTKGKLLVLYHALLMLRKPKDRCADEMFQTSTGRDGSPPRWLELMDVTVHVATGVIDAHDSKDERRVARWELSYCRFWKATSRSSTVL